LLYHFWQNDPFFIEKPFALYAIIFGIFEMINDNNPLTSKLISVMEKDHTNAHNCPGPPLHIYVSQKETVARKAWFEKYKKPVIESFNSSRGIRVRNPFSIDYN